MHCPGIAALGQEDRLSSHSRSLIPLFSMRKDLGAAD